MYQCLSLSDLFDVEVGLSIAFVVGEEKVLLLAKEGEHLVILKLEVVADQVASRPLKLPVHLRVVRPTQLLQNCPQHLCDKLARGHQRTGY